MKPPRSSETEMKRESSSLGINTGGQIFILFLSSDGLRPSRANISQRCRHEDVCQAESGQAAPAQQVCGGSGWIR